MWALVAAVALGVVIGAGVLLAGNDSICQSPPNSYPPLTKFVLLCWLE